VLGVVAPRSTFERLRADGPALAQRQLADSARELRQHGGKVYLTGPYKGAPFGLSIVVPAVAGPFNLGTVVVRAAIHIDPHTAQVTVVSDPFPQIIDGVPLQIKHVNVTIDRPGFTFNPTNCNTMSITCSIRSTEGAGARVSSPFQVANCAGLEVQTVVLGLYFGQDL
jgi:hypothetical protein